MTPASWNEVERALDAVLEREPEEWPAVLDALCGGDAALRDEVESLLRHYPSARRFLETPAPVLAGETPPDEDARAWQGRRAGPYRLVREIGRGGMGQVFLAERVDGEFSQSVAVKLLRPGAEGDDAERRFRAERQILAGLEHPHIARLLDGGLTEDGQPFLAMEYVDGVPIHCYCDEHQLGIDQRLSLFLDVCNAVQYAHRNLIVHRDLKPSNIFVSRDGQVKMLDFGIAKLLSADDASSSAPRTRTGWLLMTPQYASPELLRGEPVTTASDVYQLGLLLYELLAGRRAYRIDSLSPAETERLICEREPPAPSAAVAAAPASSGMEETEATAARIADARHTVPERLARRLRGDLDAIVLKALRREPDRRYVTAEALLEDVQRHLTGLPVRARRGTRRYRAWKFGRRHRWPLAGAALIALLLVAYGGTANVQAGQVRRALEQARLEAAKAQQVTDFLVGLFESADPSHARGDEITAREILARAVDNAEQLADQPEVQAEMLAVTGRVYRIMGQYDRARPLLDRALSLRRDLYGERHADVASSLNALATLLQHQGRYDEAEPFFRQALETRQQLLGTGHKDVAASLNNLGLLLAHKGDHQAAEALYREALSIVRSQPDPEPDRIATYLNNLAGLLRQTGDPEGAELLYRDALALKLEAHGAVHPRTALGMSNLANVLMEMGNYDEAGRLHEDALAAYRVVYGDEHPDVSVSLYSIAVLRLRQGALEAAAEAFRKTLDLDRKLLGADHPDIAYSLIGLARVHLARGEARLAEPLLTDAVYLHLAGLPDERWQVADAKGWLGESLMAQGRFGEAEPLLQASHAALDATRGGDDPWTHRALERLIELYDAAERPEQAVR